METLGKNVRAVLQGFEQLTAGLNVSDTPEQNLRLGDQ